MNIQSKILILTPAIRLFFSSSAVYYEHIQWGGPRHFASGRVPIVPFLMKDVNWDFGVSVHPIRDSGPYNERWLMRLCQVFVMYFRHPPQHHCSIFCDPKLMEMDAYGQVKYPCQSSSRKFPSPPPNDGFVFVHLHGSSLVEHFDIPKASNAMGKGLLNKPQ